MDDGGRQCRGLAQAWMVLHSRDALFGYHVVITSPGKFWNVPVKGQVLALELRPR